MKYKLIKKLNGIPEGLVFECEFFENPKFTVVKVYGGKYANILKSYINLVGIDDKDSFEKIEEDILVPDCIEIEKYVDRFAINKGKQSLVYHTGIYRVCAINQENIVKCKLIETILSRLQPGDVFFVGDVYDSNELKTLSNYNIYCGEQGSYNSIYWEKGVSEFKQFNNEWVYKVVKA